MNLVRNQGKAKWTALGRRFLLIDGIGAMVSYVCLAWILPAIQGRIGMPMDALEWLSLPPAVFAAYSLGCFLLSGDRWRGLLIGVAVANLGYCCLSVGFLAMESGNLTALGWAYFVGEILIVAGLAILELRVAKSGASSQGMPAA
ncbi:MAG: hypothetical protein U0176_16465 [Bacteroidia bacterium]